MLELGQRALDDAVRVRIATLKIRELGAPIVNSQRGPRTGLRRSRHFCSSIEIAQRVGMLALAHCAEGADEQQLDALGR